MKAQYLAEEVSANCGATMDPATVLIVLQIIVSLIQLYELCKHNKPSDEKIKRQIRIVTRMHLSRDKYNEVGDSVVEQIFNLQSQYGWEELKNVELN